MDGSARGAPCVSAGDKLKKEAKGIFDLANKFNYTC
jgi:hypothetical protein